MSLGLSCITCSGSTILSVAMLDVVVFRVEVVITLVYIVGWYYCSGLIVHHDRDRSLFLPVKLIQRTSSSQFCIRGHQFLGSMYIL